MGLRAGLDGCGKALFHRDSIPGPYIPQRVAVLITLSRPTIIYSSSSSSSRNVPVISLDDVIHVRHKIISVITMETK